MDVLVVPQIQKPEPCHCGNMLCRVPAGIAQGTLEAFDVVGLLTVPMTVEEVHKLVSNSVLLVVKDQGSLGIVVQLPTCFLCFRYQGHADQLVAVRDVT